MQISSSVKILTLQDTLRVSPDRSVNTELFQVLVIKEADLQSVFEDIHGFPELSVDACPVCPAANRC